MKRLTLAGSVACVTIAAVAAIPASRTSAAPKPPPVAIAYDEISRAILAPATPPAPGSFQADYQLAMSKSTNTAMTTPAPKKHGFGNILAQAVSGGLSGESAGNIAANAAMNVVMDSVTTSIAENMIGDGTANAMQLINTIRNGHVVRYTYYFAKNWVREDDPLLQTATISKCREHQFISLDLAKKTYRISDTTPKGCNTPKQGQAEPAQTQTQVVNSPPGSADLTLSSTSQNLGPRALEGINTHGSSGTFEMATTNATGSCRNGDYRMTMVSYVSGIDRPRAYCPLVTPKYVPASTNDVIERGGCRPRIHMKTGGAMPNAQSNKLEMYVLATMTAGDNAKQAQQNHSMSTLLERGNVAWLMRPQADPLFGVPAGFTEEK